ncbi:MAG: ABC transporter permease [Rhodospirillales bacterium]
MMPRWVLALAPLLMILGLVAPIAGNGWMAAQLPFALAVIAVLGAGLSIFRPKIGEHILGLTVLGCGAASLLLMLATMAAPGLNAPGIWIFLAGLMLFLWCRLVALARLNAGGIAMLIAPGLFGVALLYLWQVFVVGFGVPQILLPAPSQVGQVLGLRIEVLWPDFLQTAQAVVAGFVAGCAWGFFVAVVADRVPFLKRGLLPLAGLISAVPIVGIAPIMVMWFGFDWQSKAAVVVVVTFFPMLVNTLAGLAAADAMQRDLMHSYGASYFQTLAKLRLPTALPFIFNALKINSTLALIAAIVAEFFGSPILGLGFRISAEVARLNVDVVWAAIAIAALAGSLFYGAIAVAERVFTFWHPSYRR